MNELVRLKAQETFVGCCEHCAALGAKPSTFAIPARTTVVGFRRPQKPRPESPRTGKLGDFCPDCDTPKVEGRCPSCSKIASTIAKIKEAFR